MRNRIVDQVSDYMAARLRLGKKGLVEYEPPVNLIGEVRVLRPLRIGCYTYVVGPSRFGNVSTVGRYCSIAPGVSVGPSEHPTDWLSTSPFQYSRSKFHFAEWHEDFVFTRRTSGSDGGRPTKPLTIGNDVWIGSGAVILNGSSLGDGAIVAAGSVVTKPVPAYAIVGGVPAKTIRMRFEDSLIEQLLDIKWWRFDASVLSGLPFNLPEKAVDVLRERIETGEACVRHPAFKKLDQPRLRAGPSQKAGPRYGGHDAQA